MSPARPHAPRPRRTSARSAPTAPKTPSGKAPKPRAPAGAKPSEAAQPISTARPTRTRSEVTPTSGAPPSIAPRDRVVVEQAAQRFAERAEARRRVTRRKAATAVAVVLGVVVLGWAAFFSPVLGLDVDQVEVVGPAGYGPAMDVVAMDDVHAVVARYAGEPLPRLDTAALRTELLAVHGVEDVHVVRGWPRGLTLTVTPRVPVAAVPVDDQVALLDAYGVRLRTEPAAPEGLPVVQVPLDDTRALLAALTVVDCLPPDQTSQVATVAAPTQDTVTLTLSDGVQVLWGSAEDNALKAQVVATLLADENLTDVTTIDVSAPQMPVLR